MRHSTHCMGLSSRELHEHACSQVTHLGNRCQSTFNGTDQHACTQVHYLGNEGRGTVWEEIIINCPSHIQLLAMSATVANPDDLGGWITKECSGYLPPGCCGRHPTTQSLQCLASHCDAKLVSAERIMAQPVGSSRVLGLRTEAWCETACTLIASYKHSCPEGSWAEASSADQLCAGSNVVENRGPIVSHLHRPPML